jgi:hypothetical protein
VSALVAALPYHATLLRPNRDAFDGPEWVLAPFGPTKGLVGADLAREWVVKSKKGGFGVYQTYRIIILAR